MSKTSPEAVEATKRFLQNLMEHRFPEPVLEKLQELVAKGLPYDELIIAADRLVLSVLQAERN